MGDGVLGRLLEPGQDGFLQISDQGAATLASVGFICFLAGRLTGSGLVKKLPAHKVLGLYGLLNVVVCLLIFARLGWFSVFCVFLSYFFMSIMFPTIFALGIFGLGVGRSAPRRTSSWRSWAGRSSQGHGGVANRYDMSRGFIVPLGCFAIVGAYGFLWPRLSHAESLESVGQRRCISWDRRCPSNARDAVGDAAHGPSCEHCGAPLSSAADRSVVFERLRSSPEYRDRNSVERHSRLPKYSGFQKFALPGSYCYSSGAACSSA